MEAMQVISIHAPARGATRTGDIYITPGNISIHAPARGATIYLLTQSCCDLISIHAPARGATTAASLFGQTT